MKRLRAAYKNAYRIYYALHTKDDRIVSYCQGRS